MPARDGQPARKRLLGELPLAEDGSYQVQLPANTPVQLQLVDADGLALRSSAWLWVRNHDAQGCVGCHEDRERTPPNRLVKALQAAAPVLDLPPDKRRGVSYAADVKPIVDAKCQSCHGTPGKAPQLDLSAAGLARLGPAGEARRSRLLWHLLGRNTARAWDAEVRAVPPGAAARGPEAHARRDPRVRRVDRSRRTAMRRSTALVTLLLASAAVSAHAQPAPRPAQATPGPRLPVFTRRARRSPASRWQRSFGDHELSNIVEGTGSGACVFDYDGDGWLDIYFPQGRWETTVSDNRGRDLIGQLRNALYRNKGDFQFEDVTEKAGVGGRNFAFGCSAADYDDDGHVDLLVLTYGPRALPQQRRRHVHRGDGEGGALATRAGR